jgi:branched-subunit amino acid transport protein
MGPFNRNIITNVDIQNLLDPDKGTPRTLESAPPAGDIPVAPAAGAAAPQATPAAAGAPVPHAAPGAAPAGGPAGGPGAVKVPTADDYLTKLLKYVPIEILGAYLFVEGLITTNVDEGSDALQKWLGWTLVAAIILTAIYARTVLNVVRGSQIVMGAVGIAVYVFATGGWFATTSWYEDWFSGIALVLFALFVAVIKLPALPTDSE